MVHNQCMKGFKKIFLAFTKEQDPERVVSEGVVVEGGVELPKTIYDDPHLHTVGVSLSPAPRKEKVPCCRELWFIVMLAILVVIASLLGFYFFSYEVAMAWFLNFIN